MVGHKAIDALIALIVKTAKSLFNKVFGKKDEKDKDKKTGTWRSRAVCRRQRSTRVFIAVSGARATVMVASAHNRWGGPLGDGEQGAPSARSEPRVKAPPYRSRAHVVDEDGSGADQVAAALAAPAGAGDGGTAVTVNDQSSRRTRLSRRRSGLVHRIRGAAGLPFSMPVSMAARPHATVRMRAAIAVLDRVARAVPQ